MRIRTKLIIGFAVVASLIWVTVFFATNTYTMVHDEFQVLKEDTVPGAIALSEMTEKAQEIKAWSFVYMTKGNIVIEGKPVKEWLQETTTSLEQLAREHRGQRMTGISGEAKVTEELESKVNQLSLIVTQLVNLKDQGVELDELLVKREEIFGPIFLPLMEQLEEHKAYHLETLAEAEERVHQAHINGERFLILASSLITLAAVAVAFLITRMITNPIHALHKGTEIIGEGNLDYKVGTPAKDEIGQLSRAFDQMTEDLKGTTTSIDNLNKEITERKEAEHNATERVKELDCLYGISRIAERPGLTVAEIFQEVVGILPAGWQYPEIACARITVGDSEFKTANYRETDWRQSSAIRVKGDVAAYVEVGYLGEKPALDEGPFLKEERLLIDAVAERLGRIAERKLTEEALQESEQRFRTIFDTASDGILLADLENQKFYMGNTVICQMLGYSLEEIKGLGVMDIHPKEDLSYIIEQFDRQSKGNITLATDIPVKRKDGSVFYADVNSAAIILAGRAYLLGTFRDITERKQAEEKIKASLAEKEVLLKEVHHRVKNNMQVISSLLKLQSGSVKNKEDAALFEDSRDRIKSMALVYNKLYQSEDLAHVDFREYVGELARNLVHSYKAVSGKVTTSVEGGDVPLEINQAIPCGLVINELITNSLKYAFPKGRDGEIRVSLAENEGEVELTVSDDGVGIPASLDLASSPTLGLRLVGNLVEQLGGKIELDRTAGARFRITFRKSQE